MALGDFTNQINQLKDSGHADLTLSADTATKYKDAVDDLKQVLTTELANVNGMEGLGEPGNLTSAQQTKANLQADGNAFKATVGDYIKYLSAFSDTVQKAADRLIQSG